MRDPDPISIEEIAKIQRYWNNNATIEIHATDIPKIVDDFELFMKLARKNELDNLKKRIKEKFAFWSSR